MVAFTLLSLFVVFGYAQNNMVSIGGTVSERIVDKGQTAPLDVSMIVVSVDPEGSGMAEGGGVYENGSTAVLTATANHGYIFKNWTKGESSESF